MFRPTLRVTFAALFFALWATPLYAETQELTADEIRQNVHQAIQANAQAKSIEEWNSSGYLPSDVFKTARTPKARRALCEALSSLPNNDLSLFEDEIRATATNLSCAKTLISRIERHWHKQRRALTSQSTHFMPRPLTSITLASQENHIHSEEGPVILTRGDIKDNEVALTFDDGPHPTRTDKILEILKAAGVRATFFQVGENAQKLPHVSKELAQSGQTVGSHSWSHPNLAKLTLQHAKSEITAGRDAVAAASGVSIPFFRFPYGSRTKAVQEFVQHEKLATFFWNMDSLDWKIRDPKILFERVLSELNREQGGIILFHDIHEQTVIVLPMLLEELKARNFTTVVFVPH